ncbi:hypothetical protein FACS1894167_12740 [Synergistales bacterium]|nr:hypothetical protein FACS1894167_12740 [Synergistales bacterium]
MILYQKQKMENAIAYFASEYRRRKGRSLTQTWIYKFLALLDFRVLKKTGTPCLGIEYHAMKMGPVPIIIYGKAKKKTDKQQIYKGEKFKFSPDDGQVSVINTQEPDLDFFSDLELDEMDAILDEGTTDDANLNRIIEKAHEEIRAWGIAWEKALKENKRAMPMDYTEEFEGITEKPAEELTPEEDRYLCYRGMLIKEKEVSANCA